MFLQIQTKKSLYIDLQQKMRVKSQAIDQRQKMQLLLQKQLQIQAELQKCEDDIDVFEEYYLQNSWKTGNLFLGWPICTYNEIVEFMNKPRMKKNPKPYIEIEDHEKLFSISSITSKPFMKISKVNYLATRELGQDSRPKISRGGKKLKHPSQKKSTIPKTQIKLEVDIKRQKYQIKDQQLEEENSEDDRFSSEQNSESVEDSEKQINELDKSEERSFQSSSEGIIKIQSNQSQLIGTSPKVYTDSIVNQEIIERQKNVKRVTFFLSNDSRTISLEKQSEVNASNEKSDQ